MMRCTSSRYLGAGRPDIQPRRTRPGLSTLKRRRTHTNVAVRSGARFWSVRLGESGLRSVHYRSSTFAHVRKSALEQAELSRKLRLRPPTPSGIKRRESGVSPCQSAEDAGFEPATACTEPAFQLCTASFTGVRRRVLSALRRGRERGRTSANDGN